MRITFNYTKRIQSLKKALKTNGIDSLFLNKKERIYYLTGYRADDSYLLVTHKKNFLFTDSRYKEEIKNKRYNFEVILSADKVKSIKSLSSDLNIKNIGIEEDYISYNLFINFKKNIKNVKFIQSQLLLDNLMVIKDAQEIKATKKAIDITHKAFKLFKKMKKVGRTEKELAYELDYYILSQGYGRGGFETMIISGLRTASAHAKSSNVVIRNNTNLLIDLGAKSYGYNSDLTRVYTLSKMKKRFKAIFNIVKTAQDKAIKAIRPNIKISKIDSTIREYFKSLKLDKFFIHASGHGIGLLVHEKPAINRKNNQLLKPGMIFTLEPGIYLPGKFGIRLEDIVLVTKDKCEVLSREIPSSI